MNNSSILKQAEMLAKNIDMLCKNFTMPAGIDMKLKNSVTAIYANVSAANYDKNVSRKLARYELALDECTEAEGWLQMLSTARCIDEQTYLFHRDNCGVVRRMLSSSLHALKNSL